MLHVREDIAANLLATENAPLERLYIELNIRNIKWLLNCPHKPHKNMTELHLAGLNEYLDIYSSNYEEILILGDFNVSAKKNHMKCFCGNYGLKTLTHSFPLHRKFFWSFEGVEKGCIGNECVNKKTPMISKFWKFRFCRFNAYKCAAQFLKLMCDRNRFAWLSFDDFDCYEKRISKVSAKNNRL